MFLVSFAKDTRDVLKLVNSEFGEVKVIGESDEEYYIMTDSMTGEECKKHISSLEKLGVVSKTLLRALV